jgi:hypothetical protein
MAIQLVGVATFEKPAGVTGVSTATVSLTGLIGGIGTQPVAGDVIVILSGWAHNANGDPGVAGYTEIADLYANSTYDANLSLAWLVCGSTPPTNFTVNVPTASAAPSFAMAGVFRGVDNTTPIDVAPITATATGNIVGTLPSVTPVTSGAAVFTSMVSAASGSTNAFLNGIPAGYTAITWTRVQGSSYTVLPAAAVKFGCPAGTAQAPGAFTAGVGATTGTSRAMATFALRPATGRIKSWNGTAWIAEPVKHWDGSAWVQKPLKVWNGTAWVKTSY